MKKNWKIFILVTRSLLAAYIVTGISLFALAMFLFHFCPKDLVAQIGIAVIYCFSCLLGGYFIGKSVKKHKWIWGMLLGFTYYFCIAFVGAVEYGLGEQFQLSDLKTLLACCGFGIIGALLA